MVKLIARDTTSESTSHFDKIFDPTHERITAGPEVVSSSGYTRRGDYGLAGPVARKIEPRKIEPRMYVISSSSWCRTEHCYRRLWKKTLDQYASGGDADHGLADMESDGSIVSNNGHLKSDPRKRADDLTSTGGNAYTGSTGDVSGGQVSGIGVTNNDGMPTLLNMNSNNAGFGGVSASGCSAGGHGDDVGAGGNSYSGSAGQAAGGSVNGVGGMMNIDSNNAGSAGSSLSGCAEGGSIGDTKPPLNDKQAFYKELFS